MSCLHRLAGQVRLVTGFRAFRHHPSSPLDGSSSSSPGSAGPGLPVRTGFQAPLDSSSSFWLIVIITVTGLFFCAADRLATGQGYRYQSEPALSPLSTGTGTTSPAGLVRLLAFFWAGWGSSAVRRCQLFRAGFRAVPGLRVHFGLTTPGLQAGPLLLGPDRRPSSGLQAGPVWARSWTGPSTGSGPSTLDFFWPSDKPNQNNKQTPCHSWLRSSLARSSGPGRPATRPGSDQAVRPGQAGLGPGPPVSPSRSGWPGAARCQVLPGQLPFVRPGCQVRPGASQATNRPNRPGQPTTDQATGCVPVGFKPWARPRLRAAFWAPVRRPSDLGRSGRVRRWPGFTSDRYRVRLSGRASPGFVRPGLQTPLPSRSGLHRLLTPSP